MLTNTLNTNEVKNAAGTEQEFQSIDSGTPRTRIYALIGESPALQHRIKVQHQETGSGLKRVRRSMVRVDKTVISTVDNVTPVVCSDYIVHVVPVGALLADTESKNTLANLGSFVFSTGANTTLMFDGTGTGAQALLSGGV